MKAPYGERKLSMRRLLLYQNEMKGKGIAMYRGTTPTLPVRIMGVDATDAKIFVTIKDRKKKTILTLTSADDFTPVLEDGNTLCELELTQAQTLLFEAGECEVQARWVNAEGKANATEKAVFCMKDVLLKGVIAYGNE